MRKVLVTTKHYGVFAGTLSDDYTLGDDPIVLTDARCAIYWATSGGFIELAHKGPNTKSRIGSPAKRIELRDITSITDLTEEAAAAWAACK